MFIDNHGRKIGYLRLAVTDRCNLRCTYCMPATGLQWAKRHELLSDDEIVRIASLLVKHGITKIRLTGGEPFMRTSLISVIEELSRIKDLQELTFTTNGVFTAPFLPALKKLGIKTFNLSLDSVNKERFRNITGRDELPAVMNTLEHGLAEGFSMKINSVIMDGKNHMDI